MPVGLAGSCPNRNADGSGGCLYCDSLGAGSDTLPMDRPVEEQITRYLRPRQRYIIYFQTYTATHGDLDALRDAVDVGLRHSEIAGVSIATRPDCLGEEAWAWLAGLHRRTHLELELGLQSASDATLSCLNRGHKTADFRDAAEQAGKKGLRVVAHVILGLPGEGEEQVRATAELLNGLPIHGVKIHPLHIMKSSALASLYGIERMAEGGERFSAPGAPDLEVLTRERYIALLAAFLEVLREDIVLYRLTGSRRSADFLGPRWLKEKTMNLRCIKIAMIYKGIELEGG
jgi:radical SAM protein (TIGR01212 family)